MTVTVGERGLLDVTRFTLPRGALADTIRWLREAGAVEIEAFVVWTGRLTDVATFEFARAILPAQVPRVTPFGVGVHVPGDSLHELNKRCYEREEILAGQVHTHPTDAFHSETDDHYPLVTLLGGLSVVIPDFASGGLSNFYRWQWYRLVGTGRWVPVAADGLVEVR